MKGQHAGPFLIDQLATTLYDRLGALCLGLGHTLRTTKRGEHKVTSYPPKLSYYVPFYPDTPGREFGLQPLPPYFHLIPLERHRAVRFCPVLLGAVPQMVSPQDGPPAKFHFHSLREKALVCALIKLPHSGGNDDVPGRLCSFRRVIWFGPGRFGWSGRVTPTRLSHTTETFLKAYLGFLKLIYLVIDEHGPLALEYELLVAFLIVLGEVKIIDNVVYCRPIIRKEGLFFLILGYLLSLMPLKEPVGQYTRYGECHDDQEGAKERKQYYSEFTHTLERITDYKFVI